MQRVYFATNRTLGSSDTFTLAAVTSRRDRQTKYGYALVTIPVAHRLGQVERPSDYYIYKEPESRAKHFTFRGLGLLTERQFREALAGEPGGILLFVHGYNVPFGDALFKAAQIAFDANFEGQVIAFSWPSAGKLFGYDYDRESAKFSDTAMLHLLKVIKEAGPNKKLFVVAHSMGSQIVTEALRLASYSNANLGITELVFAAPDVDKAVFSDRAADIRKVAGNVTIYASSADRALLASEKKAWETRIGYVPKAGPHLLDGYEIIDVTAVGEDMFALNHSTFSGSRSVLEDLGRILVDQKHPPHLRSPTLERLPSSKSPQYWRYPR